VAARLKVSPNTVWRKLGDWRRRGFLKGYLILPHPTLLQASITRFTVAATDPISKARLLKDLELVEGVILAINEVGVKLAVIGATDLNDGPQRLRELLRRLPGTSVVSPPHRAWLPPCEGELTGEDWRLLTAVRSTPEASVTRLASKTGRSTKTVSRQLALLRKSHRMLSVWLEDWSRFPSLVAGFTLRLEPGADPSFVRREFRGMVPGSQERAWFDFPPGEPGRGLSYMVEMATTAEIDAVMQVALGIRGVARAETTFRVADREYPSWIDRRIDLLRRGRAVA
jgi:DNA-binding Lrp family transcriptional regulator